MYASDIWLISHKGIHLPLRGLFKSTTETGDSEQGEEVLFE